MTDPEPGLWDPVLRRGGVRAATGDAAWVRALLDVEAALVRAQAAAGLLPADVAERVAAAIHAAPVDAGALGAAAAESGNPVPPLVHALSVRVGETDSAHVHRGATSQDVVDTAAMLVARQALDVIGADLAAAGDAAAALAREHRTTPIVGRTLLQQAAPTTFGLKAAGWMVGLDAAGDALARARDGLAVQLGGAVGTLSAFGARGPAVVAAFAAELGLAEPVLPWHTDRTRIDGLAGALGTAAGAATKVARDLILLAQTEVGEVRDRAGGGSSAMPHKSNPVAAVLAAAGAAEAPGLVAVLLGSMAHEHERAAGGWHAEWRPLAELLGATGSSLAWLREALDRLEVDPARMRANLDATRGLLLTAEAAGALAPALGREAAHEVVGRAARAVAAGEGTLADLLAAQPEVRDPDALREALDPAAQIESAGLLVDRALSARSSAPPPPPR